MDDGCEKSGARAATRSHLLATFNTLLLEGERERPQVADIVAEAGVARSTFYDHFDGVEALLDESIGMLLGRLAGAVLDEPDEVQLVGLLDHVHENRTRARELLTGIRGERAEAQLARQLAVKLEDRGNARITAILIAGTLMAGISGWVSGRAATDSTALARSVRRAAQAILAGPDQA
jgi:AcrR family transcriptional regulator